MLLCSEIESVRSAFFKVTCGVWQDGILSPTLFAVYIDDIDDSKLKYSVFTV